MGMFSSSVRPIFNSTNLSHQCLVLELLAMNYNTYNYVWYKSYNAQLTCSTVV